MARVAAGVVAAALGVGLGAGGVVAAGVLVLRDGSPGPVPTTAPTAPATTPAPVEPTPTATPDVDLTILAAGDVLPHMPVMASARTGDGYDFGPLLAGLDAWVEGADLALCHMEVPVVPEGRPVSGYPMFGTTPDLVRDLAAQGWDGCSTASNHSVDKGFAGLARTLDVLDAEGLGHVGTARTEREAGAAQRYVLDVDGQETVVAHLSATYGTNGMPVDADKPWSVTLLDDVDALVRLARAERTDGADLVLVSVHAGAEYVTAPTDEQKEIVDALAASGDVDLVIGHHAHVPQAIERVDGGPDDAGMWVAYGLGNMISNQDASCCVAASSNGLVMIAHAHRDAGGPARVTGVEWVGITVDRADGHRIHAFADLDGPTGRLSADALRTREADVRKAVGDGARERREPTTSAATVTVVPRED